MKPVIILVRPQMGENIGAVARVMKNFGFSELRIVSPRDGWPNPKADAMAVSAVNIIEQAKVFDNLEEALSDIEYVIATTARERDMNKPSCTPRELVQELDISRKAAILFGAESTGLFNDEVARANIITEIPTAALGSLNLAQAAGIMFYEFHASNLESKDMKQDLQPATQKEIDHFYSFLVNTLIEVDFFKTEEKKTMMQRNIYNILKRIDNITSQDVNTLFGIIKSIKNNKSS